MRSVRLLVTGAFLLGTLAGFVALALQYSTESDRAIAVSPTPGPWDVEWDVQVPEQSIAGSRVVVSAEALLTEPIWGPTSPIHDPVYNLALTGSDSPLELTSAADVLPENVSDGAAWDLRALRHGEATLEISLTYKQSYCYPCDTHYYTDRTTLVVEVMPLPGDVDCNVVANSIDAALILQFAAAMLGELPCDDVADVNLDGSADALDAALILQYGAGLLDSLVLRTT